MATDDFYTTLGVKHNATQSEIKQAYRRLAKKYHPDVSQEANAEAQFKKIVEAYNMLKSTKKRRHYDSLGSTGNAAFTGLDPDLFGDLFKQTPTKNTSTKPSTNKATHPKKKSKFPPDVQQQVDQLIDELDTINAMLKQIETEHSQPVNYRFHTLLQELHQETCLLAKESTHPTAMQTAIELQGLIEAMRITLGKLTPN